MEGEQGGAPPPAACDASLAPGHRQGRLGGGAHTVVLQEGGHHPGAPIQGSSPCVSAPKLQPLWYPPVHTLSCAGGLSRGCQIRLFYSNAGDAARDCYTDYDAKEVHVPWGWRA